ncbi:MAG: type II toxin-antitoxin system RelE/ParE family toxin [Desulfobacula sp.]|nr:type II toxin-antitoxin system RelE/ParE family toxin [Desulfobacula sp.]
MDDHTAKPILAAIKKLAKNPRPPGFSKLKSRPAYRIKQGNYRIIYEIFDNLLIVDVIALGTEGISINKTKIIV